MQTLSLDQCFLRNLAINPNRSPAFAKLKKAILNAVDAEKLVCPTHVEETVFESSLLPSEDVEAIFGFQNRVSREVAFRPFSELLALETLALVRPTFVVTMFREHRLPERAFPGLQELAHDNRAAKKEYNVRVDQVPYPPQKHSPSDRLVETYRKVSMERAASMLRVVDALRVPHSPFNAATVWDYACAVGTVLQVHSVSVTELANLADKILSHEWEAIPVLCFHTLLHARIEEDILKSGRKFDANDLLDVLRLAVAIAYGDAVGCDGPMKEVVKQTKLNTHIFSIREPEAMQAWVESL